MLKICEVCGKEYEGKSFSKYCSPKCKKKKNNATFQKKRSEKRKQEWEQLEHIKQCPVCGKEFELKQTHRTQKYCCSECRKKAERLYGHKRETDLAYKDKIRFDGNRTKALERDEYTCTMCGAKKDLVIHRIAVRNNYHNKKIGDQLIKFAIDYAKRKRIHSIKVDTHKKNIAMQKILLDNNFSFRGIIYLKREEDDNQRLAYELVI